MLDAQITFTIGDMIFGILSVLAMGVLFYLIFFIRELFITLRNCNKIYDENKENISLIITEASEITRKTNGVLDTFSEDIEKVSASISSIVPVIKSATSFMRIFFSKNK